MFKRLFTSVVNKMNNKNKVVIISGGTGVGKSDLSIRIAKELNGEIVGADSVQIYKHLTIGSNKVTEVEKQGIPHHLIDKIELNDRNFCAYDYYTLVKQVLQDIISRGKTPIIVGGSGFYLDTILKGARLDLSNDQERDEIKVLLNKMKSDDNWDYYFNQLKELDLESSNIIQRNDYTRLSKSLYFNSVKGIKFSSQKNDYQDSIKELYDYRMFYLSSDRVLIHKLLNQRCENMLTQGLIQEVFNLLVNHLDFKDSKVSDSIGYRETIELLLKPITYIGEGEDEKREYFEITKQDALNTILNLQTSTRNYYRRQASWFRKESQFEWLNPMDQSTEQYIINSVKDTNENWIGNRNLQKETDLKTMLVTKDTITISSYKPAKAIIDYVYKESNAKRNILFKLNPNLFIINSGSSSGDK